MKKAGRLICILMALLLVMTAFSGCGGTESSAPPESPDDEAVRWQPEQTVEIIVPFSAGGDSDLCARAVEAVWSKYCDQPLVITNMPGGGGVTGAMQVVSSEPDGYTLEIGYGSGHDVSMPYLQELEYDPFEMLEPICMLSEHPIIIATLADSEFNSMAEMATWAEETGEAITAAVTTANGTSDLTIQAISYYTGLNILRVPHDSSANAMTDLLSGSYMICAVTPTDILPYIQSGQVKALAVASAERDPAMPDVPTLLEEGINFSIPGSIKGVAVPKNTPQEIKDYYEQLFADICADEEFKQIMLDTAQASMYMDTDEFTEYFKEASESYKRIIEDLGLAYYS